METIFGIRVYHPNGHVSNYTVGQSFMGCEVTAIEKDLVYFGMHKKDAYFIEAVDENGDTFRLKEFRGDHQYEVTNKIPATDEREMNKILKMAGYDYDKD